MGSEVHSLGLHSTGMGQAEFTRLLTPCKKLRVLNLNGARSLFREGQCVTCIGVPSVAIVLFRSQVLKLWIVMHLWWQKCLIVTVAIEMKLIALRYVILCPM